MTATCSWCCEAVATPAYVVMPCCTPGADPKPWVSCAGCMQSFTEAYPDDAFCPSCMTPVEVAA